MRAGARARARLPCMRVNVFACVLAHLGECVCVCMSVGGARACVSAHMRAEH